MKRLTIAFVLAAGFMIVSQSPWLIRSEPVQQWGNSGGDSLQPMATTVYPWAMYTYNETHSSLTKSPSPDDGLVYWFNSTGPTMYGSPAIAEGKVFIGMGSPTGDSMLAFHINNGTLAWRTRTDAQVSSGTGVSATPAYSNGLLFFGADKLYALYANNGTVKWRFNVPNTLWGSGTPVVAQGMVFIGGADRRLHALNQNTGSEVWYFQTLSTHPDGTNYGLYGAPAIWNGYAYLAAPDGYVYKISLAQSGAATASATSTRYKSMYGSPVIYDGKVYIGDGYTNPTTTARFRALNATDLSLIWAFPSSGTQSFFSSAAVAYGKVFIGSTNGNLYTLDPQTGALIWNFATGGSIWSSPAISDGKVFIGSQSNYFYSLNANQSNPATDRWRRLLNGAVDSSPAISDGRVCVGTFGNSGRIYCYGTGIAPPVNIPPFISLTHPTGAQDWSGGSSQTITWTMTDDVTPVGNLKVYLNYTSTPSSGTIAGPLLGATFYGWTVPPIDANDVLINATVIDEKGAKGYSTVLVPKIDSTRPGVQDCTPKGTSVPLTTPIVVNFTESMNTASAEAAFQLFPNPGGLIFTWSARNSPADTMTVDHAAFSSLTTYAVIIGWNSRDASDPGINMGADRFCGFTTIDTNNPPTIGISAPSGGESWTGGTAHSIDWTAADLEDSTANLRVWVNYSVTGGAPFDRQVAGLQGVAGDARPYAWTVPLEDSVSVVLQATVIDTGGASGIGLSPAFEIDSTRPQVLSTSPMAGEPNVPMSVNVITMWSEAMNTASAESAFSLKDTATWTPVAGTFSWVGDIVTYDPSTLLSPGTQYSANITTGASDDSQPGNALASTYSWTLTTASVADLTRPTLMDATAVPDPREVFFPVNVSAIVQDDVAVGLVRLFVRDPIGGTSNATMAFDTVLGRYYLERTYSRLGVHSFDVWAADTSGNWNWTSGQFTIVDSTQPRIENMTVFPNPVHVFSQTNISATVTDNYQLSGVWIEITAPDSSRTNQTMLTGTRFYLNVLADQISVYYYTISAVDSSGNWNTYSSGFDCDDREAPVISHVSTPSYFVTRTINITANVTDNHRVKEVQLYYNDTADVPHNVTMNRSQLDEYYYILPTQPGAGALRYAIWAVDYSSNEASSPAYTSSVIELRPSAPTSLTVVPEGCGSLRLNWTAPALNEDGSPLTDLSGYNIYRSAVSGVQGTLVNTISLIQGTTYLDAGLGNGTTAYYVIRAVNSRTIESARSNEANATTQASCGSTGPTGDASFPFVTVLIIVIVITAVVSVILLALLKRRKKEDAEPEAKAKPSDKPGQAGEGKAK